MKSLAKKINFYWKGNSIGIVAIWTGIIFLIYMAYDVLKHYHVI